LKEAKEDQKQSALHWVKSIAPHLVLFCVNLWLFLRIALQTMIPTLGLVELYILLGAALFYYYPGGKTEVQDMDRLFTGAADDPSPALHQLLAERYARYRNLCVRL
jgi:hypothetical protein